ncbi:MAG TPA: NAD(P)-dependent oxidoreductase, partial [Anaerolineales bacterium]|nr:NAD(P)-dependent oxidoreductase [Anaerolineales bacterium]
MRILITGINGLIGTILWNAFQDKHDVYGIDLEGEFSERVLCADISDYGQITSAFEQFRPLEAIVHLAGNPRVDASWESVLKANIIGTRNVFEAAREFQVPRLVYASTNHVTGAYHGFEPNLHKYTQPGPPMLSPQDPIRPDSDYGLSKAFGEAVARYYCDRWGIQAICLRIGAVLKHDDPTRQSENRRIWLSHRDLVQLVEKSLSSDVTFGIYYGISNNKDAFWDISNARADLG